MLLGVHLHIIVLTIELIIDQNIDLIIGLNIDQNQVVENMSEDIHQTEVR